MNTDPQALDWETQRGTKRERPPRNPWNPRAIAWIGAIFGILPAGIMSGINFGRLGFPEKKRNRILISVLLFGAIVAAGFVIPDTGAFTKAMGIFQIALAGFLYSEQRALFKSHIADGGQKASALVPVVLCLLVTVPLVALIVADQFMSMEQVHLEDGNAEFAEGDFNSAIREYTEAIRIDPNFALAFYNRGLARVERGEHERALADFTRAIELAPEDPDPYYQRAITNRKLDRLQAALVDLDKAIELHPRSALVVAERGDVRRINMDFEGAIEDYDRALALDPKSRSLNTEVVLALRGEAKRKLYRLESALADLDRAIELDPEYNWAYAERGEVKRLMEDFAGAITDFDKAVDLDPEYWWAIGSRGQTKAAAGDFLGAIADLDRAIEIDARYFWLFSERGEARSYLGDQEGAIRDLSEALRLQPDVSTTYGERGIARLRQGDFELAIADLNEAIRLKGGPWWHGVRGRAKLLSSDRIGALEDFNRYADSTPGDPYAAFWIAGLGEGTARLESFAEGEDWGSQLARFFLGRMTSEELVEIANGSLDDVVRREHLCETYAFLGLTRERDGDPEAARRYYEACVGTGVVTFVEYWWAKNRLALFD